MTRDSHLSFRTGFCIPEYKYCGSMGVLMRKRNLHLKIEVSPCVFFKDKGQDVFFCFLPLFEH